MTLVPWGPVGPRGHVLQVFACTTHGIPGHDAAARETTALHDAVTLMHCEDESLTAFRAGVTVADVVRTHLRDESAAENGTPGGAHSGRFFPGAGVR